VGGAIRIALEKGGLVNKSKYGLLDFAREYLGINRNPVTFTGSLATQTINCADPEGNEFLSAYLEIRRVCGNIKADVHLAAAHEEAS
jgi:hypothetical protein